MVISNCVINLSTDRPAVFAESFRVLRPGGRLGITDVLAEDHLTEAQRLERGAQAGCIAGAPSVTEYRGGLARAGFTSITHHPDPAGRRRRALGDHPRGQAVTMPSLGAGVRIEPMTSAHAAAVLAIYQAGIAEGNATFETVRRTGRPSPRPGCPPTGSSRSREAGSPGGWPPRPSPAAASTRGWSSTRSTFIPPPAARAAAAGALETLIASTEAAGIWTIQSGIFPENTASLALHRAAGFRMVGTRERIGQHHGRWRDVVLIERRSRVV